MSRQQYYDDSFQLPRRENLSYGGQSYSDPNMNNGSFRMSGGKNTSFGNQDNVNRFDYGHSTYDTRPVQGQSYDRVQMSHFETDYNRRNIGDGAAQFQDNRRRDSEVTGTNWGHSDQKSVPFDAQMSSRRDIFQKPLMSQDIGSFETRSYNPPRMLPERENIGSFETRSYDSPRMLPERESIGSFETRAYDAPRMLPERESIGSFETRSYEPPRMLPERESIGSFETRSYDPLRMPERESIRTFQPKTSPAFRPRPHEMKRSFNDPPQWSSSKPKYQRMEKSSPAPLKKILRKPAPPAKPTAAPKSITPSPTLNKKPGQKPNSSVALKVDPKTNAPRQPLGKIDKNTANVEKSVSTVKTAVHVKSMEKVEECPWLDAEEVTEEELRLKFPEESLEMIEETCLRDKGDLNIKENLPEGWTATFHVTGFPVYLHKPTAVVTLSKPYELGSLNIRTHMFPVASIPCLQYNREKERKISDIKNSVSRLEGDKKAPPKLIPKDKGTEFEQAHPQYKQKIDGNEKKDAKDTNTESQMDNSANIIPSNLDKKTKDAFLQFQEELESEMKQANRKLNEEEEYEKEMLNTFFKYQEDIDNPDTEETEKESNEKVIEAVDHEEFLKYCERLFEFDTVKLAVQTDGAAKSKKTYYCLGRKKRQVKPSDEGLTTVQLRPQFTGSKDCQQGNHKKRKKRKKKKKAVNIGLAQANSFGSNNGQQSISGNNSYKNDRTHPTQNKGNHHEDTEKKAVNIGLVKPIPTLITRAGASKPSTAEPADREMVTVTTEPADREVVTIKTEPTDHEVVTLTTEPADREVVTITTEPADREVVLSQLPPENPITILKSYVSTKDNVDEPRFFLSQTSSYTKLKCSSLYFGNVKFASGFGKTPCDASKRAAFIGLCMLLPGKYKMGQMQDYVPVTDEEFDDPNLFDDIKMTEPDLPYLCDMVKRMNPYEMVVFIANKVGIGSKEIRFKYEVTTPNKWKYTLTLGHLKSYAIAFHKYQGRQKAAQHILQMLHPNRKYGQLLEEYGHKNVIKPSHLIDMGQAFLPKPLVITDKSRYRQSIIECLQNMKFSRDHETNEVSLAQLLREMKQKEGMISLTRQILNKYVEGLTAYGIIQVISKNKVALREELDVLEMQI